jgi:hypothetical protein
MSCYVLAADARSSRNECVSLRGGAAGGAHTSACLCPRAVASSLVESVWAQSVARSLDEALESLAAAVRDCPDELWQEPVWRVQASHIVGEARDAGGEPVVDPTQRDALVQRWSAPWSVAWHALEVLDYDLAAELDAWAPPPPFAGKPHWQTFTSLPVPWSRSEIGEYSDYCRQRVRDTLVGVTEEKSVTLLPPAHRYKGQPYAWVVTTLVGHTTAHATQIRQFATTASDSPDALG